MEAETIAKLLKEGCDLAAKDTPEDLKKAIEKFSEIKTANVDMVYLRGNAHLRLGIPIHHQAAIDDFTQAIRLVNESKSLAEKFLYTTELYYKRAFAHQMLGENDDAIHDYSLFIARANNKGSHVLAAKGYLSRGLVYESMQRMHKAFNDINKASELTLKKNPYYEYCRERVRIAVLEIHDDVDDENEHSNVSVRENENNAQNQGNEEFTNTEKPASSEQQMDSDITSDESNATYEKVFYNALLCSEQGHVKDALEKFKEACEITSNRYQKAESLFRQGLCYYKLDEKPEARKSFEKARNCNPQHARTIFRLGMMQAADHQLKDALQTMSSAHKYAPNHVDILYERANVFEKMGKLQEAVYDRRRAMQLTQQSKITIVTLEDHIRHIKAEIAKEGESSIRRFKIGWLQETRQRFYNNQNLYPHQDKRKIINVTKTSNYFYEEAINEYRAAIDLDKEQHRCPEAHALLSSCLDQVNDILPAQEALQTLLENFKNFPQFLFMWKSFIKNVQNPNYSNEMGVPLSYIILIKVNQIEKIHKDIESDEKSFKEDQNLLLFYRECRIQLSNVLAAFALTGCSKEIIAHNMKGRHSQQVTNVLKIISPHIGCIPHVGSIIHTATDYLSKYIADKDHEFIRNKLKIISKCGDVIEQTEIARRVARRLADRYEEQLKRLDNNNKEIKQSCYAGYKSKLLCIEPIDDDEPTERVATFAVNYIISAIADKNIKTLKLKKAENKDVLVEMLVELVCRARGSSCSIPKCFHDDPNQYLPLKPVLNNASTGQQQSISEEQNPPIPINVITTIAHTDSIPEAIVPIAAYYTLSEFFRAPGLRYDHNEDLSYGFGSKQDQKSVESADQEEKNGNQKKLSSHDDEDNGDASKPLITNTTNASKSNEDPINGEEWAQFPYMNAEHYGHRLCSSIELELFKYEFQNRKQSSVCCNTCCC